MVTTLKKTVSIFLLLLNFSITIAFSGRPLENQKDHRSSLQKMTTNNVFTAMTINNIFSYYTNNGDGSLNPFSGDGGFELINANRGITIFEEGLVWGGKHLKDGAIKVGGSTYTHGLQAGRIITPGTTSSLPIADDPSSLTNIIYRIRRDVGPSTPFDGVMEKKLSNQDVNLFSKYENRTAKQIYDKYIDDWNNWPAAEGAPYEDKDGNGSYNPLIDIPGVPGADQTIWYVANDLDPILTDKLYGSPPFGIEFQRTIWAYKQIGALGNTIFQKNIIINKSGFDIDSMYFAQWADPDIGGGSGYLDDFMGCDTILELGFVYNADNNDGSFGSKSPAVGFDLFQGPLVNGNSTDSGRFLSRIIKGKKNLAMTAFPFVVKSGGDPRLGDPRGTTEWYNYMQGLVSRTREVYVNPTTNLITKYVFSGDPVTGTGWLDGSIVPAADRRLAICSGPFTMATGDTQEIIVAAIVGQGSNNLNSVSILKANDAIAQLTYDNNFNLGIAPELPIIDVVELDKEIILNWGDPVAANITENQNKNGYKFQGYNVYQVPSSSFANSLLIATFDIVDGIKVIKDSVYDEIFDDIIYRPVRFGNDNGIVHTLRIITDSLKGKPLINGESYYFAVTAYNYNPTPIAGFSKTFESNPQVIKVIPQSSLPGQRLQSKYGDAIPVTHTGLSEGTVTVKVVDPKVLTGHLYEVIFDTSGGVVTWNLEDKTLNKTILANQINQSGDNSYYITDGMLVAVQSPPSGMKPNVGSGSDVGFEIITGRRAFTWADAATFGMEGFGGAIGGGFNFGRVFGTPGSTIPGNKMIDVMIEFAQTDTNGAPVNLSSDTVSLAYRYMIGANNPPAVPAFAPYIINANGGFAYQDRRATPIRIYEWNRVTQTKGKRLNFGFLENNIATGRVNGQYFPKYAYESTSANDPKEWLFIFNSEYNATTPDSSLTVDILNTASPMLYFWTALRRDDRNWAGLSYRLHAYFPNGVADVFSFVPKAPTFNESQAKEDVQKVNVYPNPYFGQNSGEQSSLLQHVTFNHLPRKATISILTLGGVRVRKLIKDDDSQFLTWDLLNETGWLVGSGLYVVYIDMGSFGTKILKLSVIQQTPVPTNW